MILCFICIVFVTYHALRPFSTPFSSLIGHYFIWLSLFSALGAKPTQAHLMFLVEARWGAFFGKKILVAMVTIFETGVILAKNGQNRKKCTNFGKIRLLGYLTYCLPFERCINWAFRPPNTNIWTLKYIKMYLRLISYVIHVFSICQLQDISLEVFTNFY